MYYNEAIYRLTKSESLIGGGWYEEDEGDEHPEQNGRGHHEPLVEGPLSLQVHLHVDQWSGLFPSGVHTIRVLLDRQN